MNSAGFLSRTVAGHLTTFTVNSSSAFGSNRNHQRQFSIVIRLGSGEFEDDLGSIASCSIF
jgi:hypothetical protein